MKKLNNFISTLFCQIQPKSSSTLNVKHCATFKPLRHEDERAVKLESKRKSLVDKCYKFTPNARLVDD